MDLCKHSALIRWSTIIIIENTSRACWLLYTTFTTFESWLSTMFEYFEQQILSSLLEVDDT